MNHCVSGSRDIFFCTVRTLSQLRCGASSERLRLEDDAAFGMEKLDPVSDSGYPNEADSVGVVSRAPGLTLVLVLVLPPLPPPEDPIPVKSGRRQAPSISLIKATTSPFMAIGV